MNVDPLPELAAIESLLEAADLPEVPRRTVAWCLKQLPELYRELARTYESRFADRILSLTQGLLKALAEWAETSPQGQPLAEGVAAHLRALHARVGFPGLDPRPKAPPKPKAASKRTPRKAS